MTLADGGEHGGAAELDQLIYRSTSTAGVGSVLEMSDILEQARAGNPVLGLTGVLTVVAGVFVQILEGPAVSLDRMMARLWGDSRHTDIRVLARRSVHRRDFEDWAMVSPRLATGETDRVGSLLATGDAAIGDFVAVLRQAVARQDALLDQTGLASRSRTAGP